MPVTIRQAALLGNVFGNETHASYVNRSAAQHLIVRVADAIRCSELVFETQRVSLFE